MFLISFSKLVETFKTVTEKLYPSSPTERSHVERLAKHINGHLSTIINLLICQESVRNTVKVNFRKEINHAADERKSRSTYLIY